jgi:uncharacterized membrane protein YjjP (DUF1212 family)
MINSLAEYPHWFVVVCMALAAAMVLWLIVKLAEAALWILFVGTLVVAASTAVWLVFR